MKRNLPNESGIEDIISSFEKLLSTNSGIDDLINKINNIEISTESEEWKELTH